MDCTGVVRGTHRWTGERQGHIQVDCADGHIDPNSRLERGQGQTICTDGLVRSGKEEEHTDGLEKVGQGYTQMGWNGKGTYVQMNRRGVVRGTYICADELARSGDEDT